MFTIGYSSLLRSVNHHLSSSLDHRLFISLSNYFKKPTKYVRNLNKDFEKMIRVKYLDKEKKVSLSLKCKITEKSEREFNLNRDLNEPILATFQKLYANYAKQCATKMARSNAAKKLKTDGVGSPPTNEMIAMKVAMNTDEPPPIKLFDLARNEVPLETLNKDAWQNDYKLTLNDQEFVVAINLPYVKKIMLPKLMFSKMPALIRLEFDNDDETTCTLVEKNSTYQWFHSRLDYDALVAEHEKANPPKGSSFKTTSTGAKKNQQPPQLDADLIDWVLFDEGVNKRVCYLTEATDNKLLRVVVIPNDGKRKGFAVEAVSATKVEAKLDLDRYAMTERHAMTKELLKGDA